MINVIGLGYIGLPIALILSSHGLQVIGTDYNEQLINQLNNRQIEFKEKGLSELFLQALENNIKFTSRYYDADTYIVCVQTPYDKITKKIDTSYLEKAIQNILDTCQSKATIIIESTISPGTIDKFIKPIIEKSKFELGKDINIAHAPERIMPGNIIYELQNNPRTIGADNKITAEKVKNLYETFCKGEIITTDIKTAEITKVVENTYRDINIAFANELTKICDESGMDVNEIIKIANKHPRVNILSPGPGVGGHCICVDPWFLVGDYPKLTNLIKTARKINDEMPQFVLYKMIRIMEKESIKDINRIGIYGLTYKKDIDDIRNSPSIQLIQLIQEKFTSGFIKSYDPYIKEDIVKNQYHNLDEFLEKIDMVIILVDHDEIKRSLYKLKNKIIFDTKQVSNLGKTYSL